MKSINYKLQTIFTYHLHYTVSLHSTSAEQLDEHWRPISLLCSPCITWRQIIRCSFMISTVYLGTSYLVLLNNINCITWRQIIRYLFISTACIPGHKLSGVNPPLILALATINDKKIICGVNHQFFLEKLSLLGKDLTIPRHQKLDKISPEYYIQFTFIFLRSQKQTACGMWMNLKISSHKILSYCPFPESESFRCFCSQFFKAFSSLETQT